MEQTKEETMQQALFQPIGVEGKQNVEETAPDPSQDQIKSLEAKIAEQEKRLREQNDNFLKIISQRPQAQAAQTYNPPVEEVEPPDVLEDPEGYRKFVREEAVREARSIVMQETTKLTTKNEQDKKYERLYSKFKTKAPQLHDKNQKLIEFIAISKAKEAAAQGLDVDTYIFNNEDGFIDSVIEEAKSQLGLSSLDDNDRTGGLATTTAIPVSKTAQKMKEKTFADSFRELRWRGKR